ncbi:MAG: tRNA lysidine(34) synthetase TilS [Erysipelotrichaceae bacterium]
MNINLDRTGKYAVGVSGGSDSMTLLDLLYQQGYNVVVCHVNYHHRPTSDRDEKIVKDYCEHRNIKVAVFSPLYDSKENFQKWAREVRYQFYYQIYQEENCSALLLAHQMDDHIENYLMAKERGSKSYYYGIREKTSLYNMEVIRPLLGMRKKDTEQYCKENNIKYGLDESNLSDDYFRNRIRHQYIETATDTQIKQWLKEIEILNKDNERKINEYQKIDFSKDIDCLTFAQIEDQQLFVRYYLNHFIKDEVFSSGLIQQLCEIIRKNDGNHIVEIGNYNFVCEYGCFYLYQKEKGYSFSFGEIAYYQTDYFKLTNTGEKIQQLTVFEDDFPITIRNYRKNDQIKLRYGTKKVNRFFIDRKIKQKDRDKWPVVVNKNNEIIFVSGIGCDVNHYTTNPNIFVIK